MKTDPILQRIRESEKEFIQHMPRLVDLTKMQKRKIILLLCTLPTSLYRGFSTKEVSNVLNRNDAAKYLADLIMKNEQNRSQFKPISENSNDEKKFSSKSSLNPARDSGSIRMAVSGAVTFSFDK